LCSHFPPFFWFYTLPFCNCDHPFEISSITCLTTSTGEAPTSHAANPVSPVVLLTVINPLYPITVEVIHTICTPHGPVLRISILRKNGIQVCCPDIFFFEDRAILRAVSWFSKTVQAFVEFDNISSATRAKNALQGADIYAGCCTIKAEFARVRKSFLEFIDVFVIECLLSRRIESLCDLVMTHATLLAVHPMLALSSVLRCVHLLNSFANY
jgi:hypothetical protein